jgi:ubiquinone/menaquinone biosynthesis C-methylase UbiE
MAPLVDPDGREAEVLRRLVSFRGKDVLDIGCGDGRTARHIARTAASVVGIDPDAELIAMARADASDSGSCKIEYHVEDAVTMDWPEASFDAMIFTRSL